jgi:hypothetical protein
MAIQACTLTEQQIRGLYKAVSGKIIADKNNGVKHDAEAYMKQLYDLLKNAPGGSDATAMDYIQHIPRMVLAAKGTMSEDFSDYLSDSGVDLNRMDKLRVQFKDIENVKTFLSVNKPNAAAETAMEVIAEALPTTGVVDGEVYDEVEKKDEKKKTEAATTNPFDALPETGFAQVNQEAQEYDGVETKANIPDPDPKKQTYFAVVRMINKFLADNGQSNMNAAGIYLTAVREKDVAYEDLYVSSQKYLETTTNKKTPEQKKADRENGDNIFLVYTDKDGNYLYFDKEGNISTKEDGGTVAYSSIRRVYTNRDGSKSIARVQSVNDVAKKPGALSAEELQKGRNLEIEILEKMKQYVINNPESKLTFSVTSGQDGFVKENFSQRNKISDLSLEGGFSPFYSPINDGILLEGGVYFTVPGYDMPVLVKRPKFSELPSIVEAISNVLFNSDLSNAKKMEVLKQFVNNKKTEIFERDGKVFVKLENSNEILDASNKDNQQSFVDSINKLTVNINKDLIGKNFERPMMDDGKVVLKSMVYNNFISDNFYTNLEANAEGKIIKLNAYNVIQPTAEVTEKLFPVKAAQTAPVSTQPSTSVGGFQGYKGDFENTGKGTPEGDGKDKAMREVSGGFILELLPQRENDSSTGTTAKEYSYERIGNTVNSKLFYNDIVMLARNNEFKNKPLSEETKTSIEDAHDEKVSFVVGDMPGVDSQFIDYLQEIGAKFTIYHTGTTPRIQVKATTQPSTTAVKPESLLDEETLSYFKSGVDQGIEAIKKQYEERLKNLEYLSKKTALSGITQDEYDKKVNYINAEYNGKISKVGKMRYRINLESARDIELAELKRKYEGTTQSSTSVKDTKADIEQATPSDNPIDILREKLKGAGKLLKASNLSSEATDEQIVLAEQWYKNSPLAQYVPFQVMFNIVNSNASAEFTMAGITLYAGSNFTDLYHEGWHVFSQMFLTKAQKKKLYAEARNLTGSFTTADGRTVKFKNAEDIELEEFMAEDFRKFVLSNGKKIIDGRSSRNNIFTKIYNFLKALYKGQSYTAIMADMEAVGTIKDLYQKLYMGQVNDYKPSLNNVQFTLLNKGIQALDATTDENKGLTYQDSMTLVQTIDSELAGTLTELGASIGTVFTDPSLMEAIYNVVKQRIEKLKDNLDPTSNAATIIDFAINNWGSFKDVANGSQETGVLAFHKLRSNYLTFDEKYAEMSPDERDIVEETKDPIDKDDTKLAKTETELVEEFGINTFERKGNENSIVSIASNETVYLIKSLPAVDKNGNVEKNSLGSSKLVDFNRTWGIVINTVAGSINKTDMYNKLVAATAIHPELKVLVDRLQNPGKNIDPRQAGNLPFIHMWTKFFSDFNVYRIPITEVQVIREVDNGKATGAFEVRFVESDPVILQVEKNFNNTFQTTNRGEFISRTAEGINKLEISKVLSKFPRNTLNEGNNLFNFLNAIGFNLTDNAAVKREIVKSKRGISFIYDRLETMENENKLVTNPIWALSQPYVYNGINRTGESGRVNDIMKIEGKYSAKYSNNSITNVQGDQEYDLSLNNSITQMLKELNDLSKTYKDLVEQPHMAHLNIERNPFAKYSILLNSLFDLPLTHKEVNLKNSGNRRKVKEEQNAAYTTLNIVNLNGIKSMINNLQAAKEAEGGIKTTSLDINSKFLMDIHSMLQSGVMELTRRASKSSAFGVSVSKIFTKFNANDPTSYISTGYFADENKSNDAAVELFKDKIAAEMERIAIVKSGEFDNIPGFKERGLSFTIFDDILISPGLKEDLIKAADANNSLTVVNSPEFSQRIADDVVKYLNDLYTENKVLFDEMPFLSKQMMNKINNLCISDGTVAKGKGITITEAEKIAVRSYTVNSFIHNMEIISVLDGDLAMYNHLKEEYHKRNASITSTGGVFSSDPSDYKIINSIRDGKTYGKKLKVPPRSFTGVLKSAVFGDNKVKSVYYEDYLKALAGKYGLDKAIAILKPYSEMNEGDAQGWITFDSYRELSFLEGSWSPKQEELYFKIVNEEDVDPEEITEYFPPRKYQYAGPIQTSKLHIQGFHKFSLVPLVPSVVKGTNMEILHDNMVKQGFDYGLFESGSKLAVLTKDGSPDKLYSNKNRTITPWDGKSETMYTENGIFIQYLKNQVDINSKWKKKTVFSTQLRKLIINDLFKQGLPNTEEFGNLVNKFEEQLQTLQNFKKQELLEEIGWIENEKGESMGDPEKFLKFVRKELSRQDLAEHDISFVDLNNSKTGVKYDLSYSLNAEKIEKLLNAIVVKRLVRQKMNGEQLVQVSGAGFEPSSAFKKATEEEIKQYNGTNDLPTYRPGKGKNGKTTAMKVKIAMKGDYYKLLELNSVKDLAKKNNISTVEALNILIKDDKWLDKDDNRNLVTMVGVRIPVQGINSMEFMEVYEFLPESAGNILIPPSEIVAKSGSDFDIDKLTVFQPNYSSNKKYASYSKSQNAKGTENRIIESIREILEHPDNFDALIRPNEIDLVKGVADDLAKENIQGYNPLKRRDGTISKTISPTRSLEPRYNLYKHESNNIGKRTLGIGAVDNAYSSIFKRIGAYLNTSYNYKTWDKENNIYKPHPREINIRMDHNKVTINGEEHVSLSDIDTITGDKVSDLISQLMNGWVDVEKDAWIFNINGNHIAGPVLLFLLEAGVDFRTATYFVCQPLVIDYIKERTQADSPFYQSSGKGVNQGKGLNKVNIRRKMLGAGDRISAEKMYNTLIKPKVQGVAFSQSGLLDVIQNKDKNSAEAKAALAHFFELEDIMRDLTNIKLTMNVDTKPSKSFAAAQFKISDIEGLDKTDVMPLSLVNRIKTKSPISSFFIQLFQLKLFKPIMRIRADETVNDYLKQLIKDGVHENIFADAEKFMAAYKNDIPLYILQNHIKGIDLNDLTEYNSLKINKTSMPIDQAQLKIGAFVKDGVMYVDSQQIKDDFYSQAYAKEKYTELGLHKVIPATFAMSPNQTVNLQEYTHFVLEREYLRSIIPVSQGQNRAAYESAIAEKALERTFNFHYMLKGTNGIVNEFERIKKAHAEGFVKDYFIFDQLVGSPMSSDKGTKTLRLRSSRLDGETANILYENLVRLSDQNTIKVDNPIQNAAISRFFSRFIVAEYLRNGITKTADSLAPILPTDMLMKLIQDPMLNLNDTGFTKEMLDDYTSRFLANWNIENKNKRNKFRNYIKTKIKIPGNNITTELKNIITEKDGIGIYNNPETISSVKDLLSSNPNKLFIIPTNEDNKAAQSELNSEYQRQGNIIGIPLMGIGGKKWSDENYDNNIGLINKALDALADQVANASDIVFPTYGIDIVMEGKDRRDSDGNLIKDKKGNTIKDYFPKNILMSVAPRTFEFLAKELYKRFGYLHPGAENFLGFRDLYQADQAVSDKDVEDFMKKCFGE